MFKKVKFIIIEQLKTGVTPEKMTDAVLAGGLIGIFPILGVTTLLAGLVAYFFKLNQVIIQTVNYLFYPIQILSIPLYIKVVSLIFNVGDVPIRPDLLLKKFNEGFVNFFKLYGLIGLYAFVLWGLISIVFYFSVRPLLFRVIMKIKRNV
jgi:uncharacterized protein (DUF2062 family)